MKCPICDNDKENKSFFIKEMQQGLREEFEYIECSNCGCLFIKEIPENISKYYDINYAPHKHDITLKNKITDKIFAKSLTNKNLFKLIQGDNPNITHAFWNNLITNKSINKNSPILDVGCGDGKFLTILKKAGFKDLTGMDLFIDEENMLEGIKIYQASLEEFNPGRKYDLITSNHSFEHMDNQLENLKCFENLVNDDGTIVGCMSFIPGYATTRGYCVVDSLMGTTNSNLPSFTTVESRTLSLQATERRTIFPSSKPSTVP